MLRQMATHLILRLKMPLLTDLLSMPKVLVGRRWRVVHAIKNSALVAKVGGQNKTPRPLRITSILCQEKEEDLGQREDDLQEVVSGQGKANVLRPEVVNNTTFFCILSGMCRLSQMSY